MAPRTLQTAADVARILEAEERVVVNPPKKFVPIHKRVNRDLSKRA